LSLLVNLDRSTRSLNELVLVGLPVAGQPPRSNSAHINLFVSNNNNYSNQLLRLNVVLKDYLISASFHATMLIILIIPGHNCIETLITSLFPFIRLLEISFFLDPNNFYLLIRFQILQKIRLPINYLFKAESEKSTLSKQSRFQTFRRCNRKFIGKFREGKSESKRSERCTNLQVVKEDPQRTASESRKWQNEREGAASSKSVARRTEPSLALKNTLQNRHNRSAFHFQTHLLE